MSDPGVERDLDQDFINAQSGDHEPDNQPVENDEDRPAADDPDTEPDDDVPDDQRVVYLDPDPEND